MPAKIVQVRQHIGGKRFSRLAKEWKKPEEEENNKRFVKREFLFNEQLEHAESLLSEMEKIQVASRMAYHSKIGPQLLGGCISRPKNVGL